MSRFQFTAGRLPVKQDSSIAAFPTANRLASIPPLSPTVAPLATTAMANGSVGAGGSQGLAGMNGPGGAGVMMPTFDFSKQQNGLFSGMVNPNNVALPSGPEGNRRYRAMQAAQTRNWGGPQNFMQASGMQGNHALGNRGLDNQRDLGFEALRNQRDLGFGDQSVRRFTAESDLDARKYGADALVQQSQLGLEGTKYGADTSLKGTLSTNETTRQNAALRDAMLQRQHDQLMQSQTNANELAGKEFGLKKTEQESRLGGALPPADRAKYQHFDNIAKDDTLPMASRLEARDAAGRMIGVEPLPRNTSGTKISGLDPKIAAEVRGQIKSGVHPSIVARDLKLSGQITDEQGMELFPELWPSGTFKNTWQNPAGTVTGEAAPRGLGEWAGMAGQAMAGPFGLPLLALNPHARRMYGNLKP